MDIKSQEQLDAHIQYSHIQRIEKIERKLTKMRYLPAVLFFIALLFFFYIGFDLKENLNGVLILTITMIAAVGQTNVQRMDLLKELFELKYGR